MLDKIKTGQPAAVTVDGVDTPLTGTVAVIGPLKSSASTSTNPSYRVVVTLDATDTTLFNGAGASVSITVGQVDGVLTVPSSAIRTVGSQSSIEVLAGGVATTAPATTAPVTIGAVGNDVTQILTGITAGQQVVIADLTAARPTSTSTARSAAPGAVIIGGLGGTGTGGFGGGGGAGARGGAGGAVPPGG